MGNETIVITGNGYDLQCEVKSKFLDFFTNKIESHKEEFESIRKGIEKLSSLQESGRMSGFVCVDEFVRITRIIEEYDLSFMNFWDLYFLYLQMQIVDPNWADVEEKIANFILELKWDGQTRDFMDKLGFKISLQENTMYFDGLTYIYFSEIMRMIYKDNILNNKLHEEGKSKFNNAILEKTSETYYLFLLSELNRFELDFQTYLINQVNTNKYKYDQYSCQLYDLITENIDKEKVYLMNFNYTLPTVNSRTRRGSNVHGYIGYGEDFQKDSIIIGVDLSGDKLSDEQLNANIRMFTKTFRKLNHKQTLTVLNLPKTGDIKKIIFYGHSLSKADYSYFQSLFDYYDLYNSNVILEFLFSKHLGKTKEEIEYDYKSRIQKMISAYGSSMDNKDRGKNLLHKLLLEHRIQIKELILL